MFRKAYKGTNIIFDSVIKHVRGMNKIRNVSLRRRYLTSRWSNFAPHMSYFINYFTWKLIKS